MTEAPDVYPEFPDGDDAESDDQGVEGRVRATSRPSRCAPVTHGSTRS